MAPGREFDRQGPFVRLHEIHGTVESRDADSPPSTPSAAQGAPCLVVGDRSGPEKHEQLSLRLAREVEPHRLVWGNIEANLPAPRCIGAAADGPPDRRPSVIEDEGRLAEHGLAGCDAQKVSVSAETTDCPTRRASRPPTTLEPRSAPLAQPSVVPPRHRGCTQQQRTTRRARTPPHPQRLRRPFPAHLSGSLPAPW